LGLLTFSIRSNPNGYTLDVPANFFSGFGADKREMENISSNKPP